eukprot:2506918-Rhodomonas_salina.1
MTTARSSMMPCGPRPWRSAKQRRHVSDRAIYGDTTAIYGDDAAIRGGIADHFGLGNSYASAVGRPVGDADMSLSVWVLTFTSVHLAETGSVADKDMLLHNLRNSAFEGATGKIK